MSSEGDLGTGAATGEMPRRQVWGRVAARRLAMGTSRRSRLIAGVGLAAFAATGGLLAWAGHDKPILRLSVAFSSNACCSWQVWVNGTTTGDITVLPMAFGKEETYSVPLYVSRVTYLRMPLGQTAGETVVLRRIWITRGSEVVSQAVPADLSITPYQATRKVVKGGVAFHATTDGPFLDVPIQLDAHESSVRLFFAKIEGDPLGAIVGLILLVTVLAVPFGLAGRRHALLLGSFAITLFAVRSLPWLSWRLDLRDSVGSAVSYASYQGLWKTRERFILDAAAAVAVAIPAVAMGLARLRGPRSDLLPAPMRANGPGETTSGLRGRWAAALVAAPIVVVGLAGAPDLGQLIGGAPQYLPSWDANNLIFWHYLIEQAHLTPMRDFFWPYGYQWLFDLRVPWGDLLSYLVYLSLWGFLALGTYLTLSRFFSRRSLVLRYLLLTSFWVSMSIAGYAPVATRYVATLAVFFLFTGIRSGERLRSWRRAVFAIGYTELILFEPAQAVYTGAAIAVLMLLELSTSTSRTRGEIGDWLVRSLVTIGVPLLAGTVVFVASGELGGTLAYYEQINAVSDADALPSIIDTWITHPTTVASFIFWAVPISLLLGAYGVLTRSGRMRGASSVVVGLGVLALLIMQKQVLRPGIETQIWLPVVFGLAFWAVSDTSLSGTRRWLAVASAAGAIAAVLAVTGGYRTGWERVRAGPTRLANSVGALVHQRPALAATARLAFAPAAFEKFTAYQPVISALRATPTVRTGGPVWILGDDSPITMMLGRSWPYYFSDLYDASPIAFQLKVIGRLERIPPARVVWNFSNLATVFDSVPASVRSPLLYRWTIARFVPERTVGTIAILRARGAHQAIPLGWWRRRLGSSVDLGHIPVVARLPVDACRSGRACGSFLVASIERAKAIPAAFDIPVTVGGMSFDVKFAAAPGVRRYVVPLDRLWFWGAARGASVPEGSVGPADVAVVHRALDPNVLY